MGVPETIRKLGCELGALLPSWVTCNNSLNFILEKSNFHSCQKEMKILTSQVWLCFQMTEPLTCGF